MAGIRFFSARFKVQGRFLHPVGADDWDQVGIVRYRSRRDMLKMAVEIAGLGVDNHKWASLEKTQVFPVKPLLHLAFIRMAVAVFLFSITTLVWVLFRIPKF